MSSCCGRNSRTVTPIKGRAAKATADDDFPACVALVVLVQAQADVMHLHGGAVIGGAGHGDLELARQVRELGMQRGPLPDQFGDRTRIGDLVSSSTGPLVGRDIADAIAGGLDRMHLDIGESARGSLAYPPA